MKTKTEKLKYVIDMFIEITEDIEDVLEKDWLKTSIVSNLSEVCRGIPRPFIQEVVDIIYRQKDM